MSSPLPMLPIDGRAYEQALSCVHCGLCMPACPTYLTTGQEADSPRGRIQLMRGLADGVIEATPSVRQHLDLCLDCRGCETACPSGVVYHELIEETRFELGRRNAANADPGETTPPGDASTGMVDRFLKWIFFEVFTHRARLRLALLPARLLQLAGLYDPLRRTRLFRLLPIQLRKMAQMLPAVGSVWPTMPSPRTAAAKRVHLTNRGRKVGFFAGCIGSVMFDGVNRMAVELLAACGVDVVTPPAQVCCGAIHHHAGSREAARELARRNIDTFLPVDRSGVEMIAVIVAGCGAMLREYDVLLRDDPMYAARAKAFAAVVRDISEVLLELDLPTPLWPIEQTVTYHDACHLAHAQKVTAAPRRLLAKVSGLRLVALPESDLCCGAAGTYNLTQPEMSTALAARKLDNIKATGAPVCVTGNVGCAMQIQSEANGRGQALTVVHPVELLHAATFGSSR